MGDELGMISKEIPRGEIRISLYGSDEAANIDGMRTDPDRILWVRPWDGRIVVAPLLIPAAEGVLYNPGATAAEIYEVSFLVTNIDVGLAAVTVSIGVEVGGAGAALTVEEYWLRNEEIPYPGSSGWRGPFTIAGDDDVRGIASAADDATIHWKVRRLDSGA